MFKLSTTVGLTSMFLFACSPSGSDASGAGGVGGAVVPGGGGMSAAGTPIGAGGTGVAGTMTGTGNMVGVAGTITGGGGTITGAGGGSSGMGGTITGAGGGSAGSGGGAAGGGTVGCMGQNLLPSPSDPSLPGPWKVGVKTVHVDRDQTMYMGKQLTVEVTYPAAAGSEAGKTPATYDTRDWLPKNATQGAGFTPIADSESPAVTPLGLSIYRDLPIDTTHGPYPVIIFMHGTGSFRIASGTIQAIWASRGFVVVAADYPGLFLADQLCTAGCGCTPTGAADYPSDFKQQVDALTMGTGDMAFFKGHVDMAHLGFGGHSVGGCTVAASAAALGAQVIIPLSAAAPITGGGMLKSVLYMSGMSDTVFNYKTGSGLGDLVCPGATGAVTDAYNASPTGFTKRLVGVTNGGHLTPTDLCQKNADGNNAIQVLHNHKWCGVDSVAIVGLPTLFDCGANMFDWKVGVKDVAYATTAAFEETLTCQDRKAIFTNIKTAQPTIGDSLP